MFSLPLHTLWHKLNYSLPTPNSHQSGTNRELWMFYSSLRFVLALLSNEMANASFLTGMCKGLNNAIYGARAKVSTTIFPGRNLEEKTRGLFQLLREDRKFEWTKEAKTVFRELNPSTTNTRSCWEIPRPSVQFTVAVDASGIGIAVESSKPSGVIEYVIRLLTNAERKYSSTEKFLAIVWALNTRHTWSPPSFAWKQTTNLRGG